jgi:hypothetical protein
LYGVKQKVRSLVGDPAGDFCTDDYLTPLINITYEAQTTKLMADTDSSFDDWVFDVPGVPTGTTNLRIYQSFQMPGPNGNVAGPLAGLVTPEILEWKQVGQPDQNYLEAGRVGKLPNVSPAAPQNIQQMQWEWRDNVIYVVPMTFPVDLRIRGEFSPPTLVKDTDELIVHPRMGTATAFGTGALIGSERSNAGYVTRYDDMATDVLGDISNLLTKGEQGTTTRIGRYGGSRSGYGRGTGWG